MTDPTRRIALTLWCAGWVTAALLLVGWAATPAQLARGCWLGEWPFEQGCEGTDPSAIAASNTPEVYVRHLQHRVGDSRAYAWLAASLWRQAIASPKDGDARSQIAARERIAAVLPMAAELSPNDENVLTMQADVGLRTRNWPAAAKALVTLVERQQTQARAPLAAMMTDARTAPAVRQQLTSHSRWLEPLLLGMDAKVPVASLQDFVIDGLHLGVLRTTTVTAMIDRLKSSHNWIDAYSLWVALLGKVPDGLYNAGFDQRTSHSGFDWDWPRGAPTTTGLRVTQVSATPRPGNMLQVEMTGRAAVPQPMVSQVVVMGESRLRLSGRYMSDRLLSKEGLVWALRCADGGERFAQTTALMDTQRQWTDFTLDVNVPARCGGAIRLALETTQAWEAAAGISGVLYFDTLSLAPRGNDAARTTP